MGFGPLALGREGGPFELYFLFPSSGKAQAPMGSNPLDWNRSGIQRLILDAEDALTFLNNALANPDPEERARAMRNGRLIYKELIRRRRGYLLTPVAFTASERLLEQIKANLRRLRDSLFGV